jgi:hypothetical protein
MRSLVESVYTTAEQQGELNDGVFWSYILKASSSVEHWIMNLHGRHPAVFTIKHNTRLY